jgi:hypothetical protein
MEKYMKIFNLHVQTDKKLRDGSVFIPTSLFVL